jgi:hypothetical protein
MRARRVLATAVLAAATFVPSLAAGAQQVTDPTGVIASPNVEVLGSLPNPGAAGARFRGDHMYVTTFTGWTIYDISDPAAPAEVGRLPLPHFENEDVDLGRNILLISNDAAESTGLLHVIDISDPTAPMLRTSFPMGGNPIEGGAGHTASCIKRCRFAWVTDNAGIRVIDLRNPDAPKDLGTYKTPAGGGTASHDVQVDGDGYAWVVGLGGAAAYKIPKGYAGKGLGRLVTTTNAAGKSTYLDEAGLGEGNEPNDFILHNSLRRAGSDTLYVTEEDYARPGCRGAGSFETWKVDADGGRLGSTKAKVLDTWVTELVEDTAQPAALCSAHYFDERNRTVAQGWYQQGTRFLDVSNPRNVRQIGFIAAPGAVTWAAHFAPTDPKGRIVYTLDATFGITVVRLNGPRNAKAPTVVAPVLDSWRAPVTTLLPSAQFGTACLLPTPLGAR